MQSHIHQEILYNGQPLTVKLLTKPGVGQMIVKELQAQTPNLSENATQYYGIFKREYHKMKEIEQAITKEAYCRYFPEYYSCGYYQGSQLPYISMEYIPGLSLEDYLIKQAGTPRRTPHSLLTKQQLLHLFEQLHDLQTLLYKHNILQLDLNPQNIIITNEDTFDIKLVDFTHSVYLEQSQIDFYKVMDHRIDTRLCLSRQLQVSLADLFTRMFYHGNGHYQEFHYSQFPDVFSNYHILLDCFDQDIFLAEAAPANHLYHWNLWYDAFLQVISKCYP